MAKSKSQTGSANAFNPSLAKLLLSPIRPSRLLTLPPFTAATLRETEDRRRYNPTKSIAPPASIRPGAARVRAVYPGAMSSLRFSRPPEVAICARRKTRREVIFALGKRKKGSGAQRKRNFWSNISC